MLIYKAKAALVAAISGLLIVTATACSSPASSNGGGQEQSVVSSDPSAYAAIIDVRTPEEFSTGHVPGALNINAEGPTFETEIAALDPAKGTYLIYCRSGNRSAVAAEKMRAAGLTVVDGGGLSDMTNAGWEIS